MPVKRIVLVGTVAVALTCLCVAMGQATTLVALRSPGWRYKLFPGGIPAEVFTIGYDDSQWATGAAPFVGDGGCDSPGTAWPGFRVVFRRHFTWLGPVPPAPAIGYTRAGGNSVNIWMNGIGPSTGGNNECLSPGDYTIKQVCTLLAGDNVIVVYVPGFTGFPQYFDGWVETDAVVPVQRQTWGQLKVVYR